MADCHRLSKSRPGKIKAIIAAGAAAAVDAVANRRAFSGKFGLSPSDYRRRLT